MKILLVEDNEDSQVLLQYALEASGYKVTSAYNGLEGLASARGSQPDLIISDIMMPKMDGFAFCREIKNDEALADIPFIFYTATYIDPKDEKLAKQLGADQFLVKPQDIPVLLKIIRETLDGSNTDPSDESVQRESGVAELYQERLTEKLDKKVRELEAGRTHLLERERHFRGLVETAQAVPWEVDAETMLFTYVGPQAVKLLGYPVERWYEKDFWMGRVHPDDRDAVFLFHRSWDARIDNHEIEFRMFDLDGDTVWIRCSANMYTRNVSEGKHAGFMFDITQHKTDEERLMQMANFDSLTGLPNRNLAMDRLKQALLRQQREHTVCALLFIDLDQFKKINDTQGHKIGDHFLEQAARRLKSCVREGDTTARLGGDEFLVILPELDDASYAEIVAEKILTAFNESFVVDGKEYYITASIGITIHPVDGDDAQILLRNADAAMYQAKHEGRNRYRFFTQQMNDHANKRLDMESQLRRALDNDELDVFFHSFHDVATKKIMGGEALMRWSNEALGEVSPEEFIPLAEETGLIVPMGEWILARACEQAKQWQQQGLAFEYLSINISPSQLRDDNFIKTIGDTVQRCDMDASNFMLEVTERLFMEDVPQIQQKLAALKEIGVRLAIDDFGIGYSSLAYLKRFDFDVLKIDRDFMRGVPKTKEDAALTSAMIVMAHSLGLKVIGEGVESKEQLDFLNSRKCDMAQGYYFDHPANGDEFSKLLQD